jgi:hypothetical protein
MHLIIDTENTNFSQKDFWFNLNNDENICVSECSLIYENDNIYEFNDVLVYEKYRGNNYSNIMISKIIDYMKQINPNKITLKIMSYLNNIASYNSYKKVFGEPYKTDYRFAYFFIKI